MIHTDWLERDKVYEDIRNQAEPRFAVTVLAGRVAQCQSVEELDYVRSQFIDDKDDRQIFLYRRKKTRLLIASAIAPGDYPPILSYIEKCFTRAKAPTEAAEYGDLWNEAVGHFANATIVAANELRFSALGKQDRKPIETAINMLEDVRKLITDKDVVRVLGFAELRYVIDQEIQCLRDLLAPESIKELQIRTERSVLRLLQGRHATVPLIGLGILIGALLMGLITSIDTVFGWFAD